jgi:hypothetical protein
VPGQQCGQVGVQELVPVQGVEVSLLPPRRGGESEPAAPSQRLRLGDGDDLRAEAGELRLEEPLVPRRTADEDAGDPRAGEPRDLVRGQRPPGDRDEGLRTPLRGLAEALGLAPGQDDRLHGGRRLRPA